jgi:Protein of unknown function (DUF402)
VGRLAPLEALGLTAASCPGPDGEPAAAATPLARGQVAVVRQHRRGRFRAVTPTLVVEDGPERTVLYVPRGTVFMAPADRFGHVTRHIADEAGLTPDHWRDRAALHIVPAGAAFSVMARWQDSFDEFSGYYVNLQEPLRRTAIGFDTMDQTLDVVVSADLANWRYKDEDELEGAAADGFFDAAEVIAIRRAAHAALDMLTQRRPPFDEPWASWRPDPSWGVPALPPTWESEPVTPSPWAA